MKFFSAFKRCLKYPSYRGVAGVLLSLNLLLPAIAGPGHDHGDETSAPSGLASPRVSTHSDLFELVGIVKQNKMTIYLDHFSTNEPISKADIELEIAQDKTPIKLKAVATADGTFEVSNHLLTQSGTYALSFTVSAGKDTDLLAGEIQIGAAPVNQTHADQHAHAHPAWEKHAGFAALGLAVMAAISVIWVLLRNKKRNTRAVLSLAGLSLAAVLMAQTKPALAGPGHDHGDAAPAATSDAPKRLPDGSVFVPKPSQRQLQVRTIVAAAQSAPQTVELLGKVIADPNAGGKVQPLQAGRIEVTANGLPTLGSAVRKGQVLALVRTSVSPIERANQGAQAAELRASLDLARKRLARLEQLEGTVPQTDIETARAEVQSFATRAALVAPSVSTTESLLAPISGVIATANVVAGQVVDARELLFEIVDPEKLMIEATAFDAALISNIGSASLALPNNQSLALKFSGSGRSLREGAIPLQFRTAAAVSASLAVGQSVKLVVQTKSQTQGYAVPTASLVKNPSNQDIVWVHTGEEQFAPRTVRWVALDGSRAVVVDGLKADDRVVTQGAALLNQVR
jgi:hypothetical protein